MQRYDVISYSGERYTKYPTLGESENGHWVRYEDAAARINELNSQNLHFMRVIDDLEKELEDARRENRYESGCACSGEVQ